MKQIRIFCIIAMLFICTNLKANNILISNITSVTGSGFVQLQFDLSWENSWYNSINHDAAWIFFKFKDLDGTWRHLKLTSANNSISAGYTIAVPNDLAGAFIYRNSTGAGTVTLTGVRLGVNNLPGSFDVKGFAIEMVRIPMADTYYLGDGTGASSSYQNGTSGLPFLVNANTITMGTAANQLNDVSSNGTLATGYPIGYNSVVANDSFFMMKHEVTMAAYRDFLNTLTYDQQVSRTATAPNSPTGTNIIAAGPIRQRLEIMTTGVSNTIPAVYGCDNTNNNVYNEATDGEWVAMYYLNWPDLAAFLDWAALRPMTELEFEKTCRGPLSTVAGEYASGTSALATFTFTLANLNASNETVSNYSGSVYNTNINLNANTTLPTRVGIHATAFSTRISAGAGYYGCLDLSGNVEEFCVGTHSVPGRSFTGISGNGTLNTAGDADEDFWPGINGNTLNGAANTAYLGTTGVTGSAGITNRGGDTSFGSLSAKVSQKGLQFSNSPRTSGYGGRGVKSF